MLKNIIATFLTRILVAFVNLGILLVASRELGSGVWGQISLIVINLAVIQTINDIYTGSALVYFVPQHNLFKIYRTGILWTLCCVIIVNMGFLLFSVGFKDVWAHVMLLSFITTIHGFHNVILLAREKLRVYNFLAFFQPAILLVFICINIFYFKIETVYAYINALYFSMGGALLISTISIIKTLTYENNSPAFYNAAAIIKNGFINELGNLAHTLSNRLNYYMLQGNVVLVGIYASGSSLIESIWIISASISPVILTHVANRRDLPDNARITFILSKICFVVGLAGILILLLIPSGFFTALLGNDFSGVKTVMLLLSPGVLCISFSSIISHYFSGSGRQKILLQANASGLLVTICASYFLISRFGLKGACYAATLSYMVQAGVLTVIFMRENKLRFSDFGFRASLGNSKF